MAQLENASQTPGQAMIRARFTIVVDYQPIGQMLLGSWSLREAAAREAQGSHWKCMGSLLLLAFAVEAYAQLIGPALFGNDWLQGRRLERAGYKAKLKAIGEKAGVSVDFAAEPWASIQALYDARSRLAHARPASQKVVKTVTYPADVEPALIADAIVAEELNPLLSVEALAGLDLAVRDVFRLLSNPLGIDELDVFDYGGRSCATVLV